ncbi:CDK-activating kinase assembly factor [Cylindrobasidium torrendii FP15055 ss-10]|uniref:RNA polymerase II transcription factor B subunit 3 n=1 Tax=Cylindrobasidium torrendii FP15055 ss-10 TaxID=1314674 RepID=A0A0D7B400_9AGAR|nr:CDK-activating kinase assembly factor [Cylindrobasidium torrendii FP15055 ss-10]
MAQRWLQGKTVRKGAAGGSSAHTRSSTPQVQSTSTTVFGGGVKDPSGRTAEFMSMDDQCPVCKSDRYLNPKLRLLVSSCYHKMCESCIDRLYTLGPAPCPICDNILRKLAFTPQTFEDLGVEKEVAIRRRIAKDFNKRREDFDDLRAFNDYLQEVEDIAWNLIHNIDVPATEKRIADYRATNAALITLNIQREEAYIQSLKEQEEFERQEREYRANEARKAVTEEREEREKERQEIIDRLETSDKDAAKLVAKQREKAMKRTATRLATSGYGDMSRLLAHRNRGKVVQDLPHVPLQDNIDCYETKVHVRMDGYDDFFSEAVRKDREGIMRGGGYRVEEAWGRALRCAMAGLDVMPQSGLETPAILGDGDIAMAPPA